MRKEIILLLIFFFSCSKKDFASGNINTITVIASQKDKIYSEHIVQHFLNGPSQVIKTPQDEYVYEINWADLGNLDHSVKMKNVLFLSMDHPSDSSIDILSSKILRENNVESNIASFSDLFAQNQKVSVLKVTDAVELEKIFELYSDWLLSEYDSNIHNHYYDYLNINGSNEILERNILDRFKISMFIQQDYEVIHDLDNLLWIGRGYPYRWLVFYKVSKDESRRSPYSLFEEMLAKYKLENMLDISNEDFRKTMKVTDSLQAFRGIYSNNETGGPFTLYMLDNVSHDEVILVASVINNPGKKKIPHLLQVDALLRKAKF